MTRGKDANKGAVVVGILHRYVMGEVFRGFALLRDVDDDRGLRVVHGGGAGQGYRSVAQRHHPPGPLRHSEYPPYTIPVSLLFSVTVVYGRLAGDNEIIAVKTAGLSVMTVLWPTLLFAALFER